MILYHGSNIEIIKIDLEQSKPFKDFGKGFYLSDVESQAEEMAKFRAMILGGTPIVTGFSFDFAELKSSDLRIRIFEDYSEEWLDFVIDNRAGVASVEYDFVYGPIADDKVGLQLRKYKDRDISKEELMDKLRYIKGITFQYFFGSENAIKYLRRL